MYTKPILIVDGLNLFTRAFMVVETITADGVLVGGVTGFIRSLGLLITQLKPDKVYVVWEQGGPSPRRKHICPTYKANRGSNKKLQESFRDDGKITPQNKVYQLQLLTKALGFMPICQLYVPDTEADDVIAYLVRGKFQNEESTKIVVSNDKDFYQLLEDKTVRVYDPARKILIDSKYVLEKFGISARNFTLARSIVGDKSDNLEGVRGIGLTTVSSRFTDFVREDVDLNQQWLRETSMELLKASKKPPKCFGDILAGQTIIDRNWKLMYLDTSCLASTQLKKIDYKLEEFKPSSNLLEFMKVFTAANIPITEDLNSAFNSAKTLIR